MLLSFASGIGPENWKLWYPDAAGKMQSPIPLKSDAEVKDQFLVLNGYDINRNLTGSNLGHIGLFNVYLILVLYCLIAAVENTRNVTLMLSVAYQSQLVKLGSPAPCFVTGVHGWQEKYSFNHFHMHWGKTSDSGSEHCIDGKFFPMEVCHYLQTT